MGIALQRLSKRNRITRSELELPRRHHFRAVSSRNPMRRSGQPRPSPQCCVQVIPCHGRDLPPAQADLFWLICARQKIGLVVAMLLEAGHEGQSDRVPALSRAGDRLGSCLNIN